MRVIVNEDASVVDGPNCPIPGCGRQAIFVVESRSKHKCGGGHRWLRDRSLETPEPEIPTVAPEVPPEVPPNGKED